MDYFTRQLVLLLSKISEALEKQYAAIDVIRKNTQQQQKIQNERLEKVLTANNESERNRSTNEKRQYGVHNSSRWAAWVTAFFTLLAVGSASFYAWVSYHQWQDLRRNFKIDERAWVEINTIRLKNVMVLPVGRPVTKIFTYDLTLKNFGKTIARDVIVKHIIVGNTWEWGADAKAIQGRQDALVGQKTAVHALPKVVAPGIETMPFQVQADAARKNFYDSNAFSYIVGRIDYKDVFQKPHWIKFCFVVNLVEDFVYCQEGNDEDNNS